MPIAPWSRDHHWRCLAPSPLYHLSRVWGSMTINSRAKHSIEMQQAHGRERTASTDAVVDPCAFFLLSLPPDFQLDHLAFSRSLKKHWFQLPCFSQGTPTVFFGNCFVGCLVLLGRLESPFSHPIIRLTSPSRLMSVPDHSSIMEAPLVFQSGNSHWISLKHQSTPVLPPSRSPPSQN